MAIHNEIEFENDICEHLANHGWLLSTSDVGYDAASALFPEDVIAWIKESQPQAWGKFVASQGAAAEEEFLARLQKQLDADGTLDVLRYGFKLTGAGAFTFQMAQYKPAFGFNAEVAAKYKAMRLRVIRQVHYSERNKNSIDLVLFLNGIPVATLEVKTDFTQAIENARAQYRHDRLPKDPISKKSEPLLSFKRGALVHFAVSTEEVSMTTKLEGGKTQFLPFNMGNNGRKGNPTNPDGYDTFYLWEQVLQRDNWLKILGSFVQLERKEDIDPSGKKIVKESIIFPRYHQMVAVNKLVEAVRIEGPGNRYLLQHSAGSGKSNTIGWTAHQLSTLHDASDKKIFDSVIVITDRTVLDEQLKDTIKQFQSIPGVVVSIDNEKGAKSGSLLRALQNGALIIIVTLQTFPFILTELSKGDGLAHKTFAVIIDEAHSSQSGAAANKLRSALVTSANEDDAEEATAEDLLIAKADARALPPNASFIAFTATPKSKTLELFGRRPNPTKPKGEGNLPLPFHLYTMRQAIDEDFILDVLQNYLPYRVAYKLAHNGKDWDDTVVDKSEGMKQLARWVKLHPYNISQKVQVIVEHFRVTVSHLLEGKAKAMVVTASRQEAVRFKLAIDKYIQEQGYKGMGTIVAFSGDVVDPDSGPDKFNEGNMNKALNGANIRKAFRLEDYKLLIVANKFQTGFDEPLLCAMYVDKRLDNISAVQTLSRLNRMHPGKKATYVLDFVNDVDTIRKAFEPYYEQTELLATTDPNLIYDLQSKLGAELIYTEQEAGRVVDIYFKFGEDRKKASQKELMAALSAPVDRFKKRWLEAEGSGDKEELDRLTLFHKNLGSFCRLYDFLSQIVRYEDISLEQCYIFFSYLEPLVKPSRVRQEIDLSGVVLTHHKLHSQGNQNIPLRSGEEEETKLKPITDVGTGVARDPEKVKLEELIEKLNNLFDDGSLTDADTVAYFNHIAAKMMEDEDLVQQAKANSRAQFKQSPTLPVVGQEATISAMDSYGTMSQKLFQEKAKLDSMMGLLADHIWDKINGVGPSAGAG